MRHAVIATTSLAFLLGCAAEPEAIYTPPEASGLVAVRAYPGPVDVCQVIGENALTADLLDHTQLLIGCPTHETGAIADRQSEGAVPLEVVGAWQLLAVPG